MLVQRRAAWVCNFVQTLSLLTQEQGVHPVLALDRRGKVVHAGLLEALFEVTNGTADGAGRLFVAVPAVPEQIGFRGKVVRTPRQAIGQPEQDGGSQIALLAGPYDR